MDKLFNMNKQILEEYIIRPALKFLDMESDSAVNILLGTCAQESLMGKHVRQMSGGPAIGIYQIEPKTHEDVIHSYVIFRNDLMRDVQSWQFGQNMSEHLSSSVFYQTIIARLIYYRVPDLLPEPDDVKGLAHYWKKYYNTPKGSGTPEEFMQNYNTHIRHE